ELVADPHAPDHPIGNGVNRSELWKINRPKLRRRFKSIELQNRKGIWSIFFHVGKVGKRLDHVHQSVQTKRATLHLLPFSRDFKRSFRAGIEDASKRVPSKLDGIDC